MTTDVRLPDHVVSTSSAVVLRAESNESYNPTMVRTDRALGCNPVLEVFVDYALVGYSTVFPVALSPVERAQVAVGSVLLVTGDGVDDRFGEIIDMSEEPWVIVRLSRPHDR